MGFSSPQIALFRKGISVLKLCPYPHIQRKMIFNMKDAFFAFKMVDPKEIPKLLENGHKQIDFLHDIFKLPYEIQNKIFAGFADAASVKDLQDTCENMRVYVNSSSATSSGDDSSQTEAVKFKTPELLARKSDIKKFYSLNTFSWEKSTSSPCQSSREKVLEALKNKALQQ